MGLVKKTLTILLISILIIYITLYLCLPYVLNKNDYSKLITDTVKRQTGLVLLVHKYNLSVSPLLEITLKSDNIQLFYPDKKQILDVKGAKVNISTLCLLKKNIKINEVKADEFQFATKLLKTGKTTIQEYLDTNVKPTDSEFTFDKRLPKIALKSYVIKIKDEKSGQKFKIEGSDFKISQPFEFNYMDITTKGVLYCFHNQNASFDIKVGVPKNLIKDLRYKTFDLSFANLYQYKLYADVKADVKIHEKDSKFNYLTGIIDIDKFSILLGNAKLPDSYFHVTLSNGGAKLVSKFYTDIDEKSDVVAFIKTKKPYEIDMKCKCPRANISNLQRLAVSLLDLLKVKNNLAEFKISGVLSADFAAKTNMKKLFSSGTLNISNARIAHKSIPLNISDINALVDFSNNEINIKKSELRINNQPLKVKGYVNSSAFGDISATANNLDLNYIMSAFPVLKAQKFLKISSGKLSFDIKIKGKLLHPEPKIYAIVKDFAAIDVKNKMLIRTAKAVIDARTKQKQYKGVLALHGFYCNAKNVPNLSKSITSDLITAKFDNKDFIISPSKFNMGNAKLIINGKIENYLTAPNAQINASGAVDTSLIKSFLPSGIKVFSKGYLPLKAKINSDTKNFDVELKILSNQNNYITPILIQSFAKSTMLTDVKAKIKNGNLILDDANLYYAHGINNLNSNINVFALKKAIQLNGIIKNFAQTPIFDNVKVVVPNDLNMELPAPLTGKALFTSNLLINGTINKPNVNGKIELNTLSVPKYFISTQNATVDINKSDINIKINNLKIKDMILSIEANAPVSAIQNHRINTIKIDAGYIDMDYLLALSKIVPQAAYGPGVDFPFVINSGTLNIKTYKMGTIKAQNLTADIKSEKNILHIKNMFCDVYGGKAAGYLTYNFPYSSVNAVIQGRNMEGLLASRDFMPKEQQLSGKLNFDATVNLYGATSEQMMKNLNGNVDVLIKNGHLGQLGRFEHFMYAQNLLSQRLIYASLNSAKQAIKPKDTGYFTYLKGKIRLRNSQMYLNPVYTSGPQMGMYITGSINPLTNYADLIILGKISSEVSGSMGLLGTMTIKDFIDEHTKYGTTLANLFNFCNSELPEIDISKIPGLTPDYRYSTKNFMVLISGNAQSVKAVKSFTWVNPPGTKQKMIQQRVKDAITNALPQRQNHQQTLSSQAQAGEQNQTQQSAVTQPVQQQATPVRHINPNVNSTNMPSFLDNIPDTFK